MFCSYSPRFVWGKHRFASRYKLEYVFANKYETHSSFTARAREWHEICFRISLTFSRVRWDRGSGIVPHFGSNLRHSFHSASDASQVLFSESPFRHTVLLSWATFVNNFICAVTFSVTLQTPSHVLDTFGGKMEKAFQPISSYLSEYLWVSSEKSCYDGHFLSRERRRKKGEREEN